MISDKISENKVSLSVLTTILLVLGIVLSGMIGGDTDAPDFILTDTDENEFRLSEYKNDKVVILDFMYTTCEPCKRFVKESLEPYSLEMDKENVAIISISVFGTDDEDKLEEYVVRIHQNLRP